ncbi:MAG TPA: glucose-6-phosphate isomerase [Gemmatimonadales bacterium]|nr:glucose-6-phosphate isomerase [Gemmatimonadales bacterium]
MEIRIDYTNMMAAAVSGGLEADDWREAGEAFRASRARVNERDVRGELGFLHLPERDALRQACETTAGEMRPDVDDVVVLGIGGSALGPIALRTALLEPGWNLLTRSARNGLPRLHVLDNVDPATIAGTLDRVDIARTLFIVTSKSGGTAETMAQFLVANDRVRAAGLPVRNHFVFITDPDKGALRALAASEGIRALEIPADVGGRFSVLTPVGLFPAAMTGIDIGALLRGAAIMRDRCATDVLSENPAGAYATLQWLAHTKLGKSMHVCMPYSDSLRDIADWFVQLWAESLGKVRPDGTSVGPTPIAALGATDQHSQVQLFMEGPADKTVSFLAVGSRSGDVEIPSAFPDVRELAYLGGHTLGALLDIEQRATAGALARRGRPNLTITMGKVDAEHLGALFMFFELATAYAGELYGVNAYDQPGVELGKQFAYAMLGRPDAQAAREEWDRLPKPDPSRTI